MNRYLLLILLSSWAHVVPLSLQCETGVAYPKHVLSIQWSLMANADVALLKTYKADTLDKCITDCCAEKFGSCSVASFKKTNDTDENCQHFYCLPILKCKFVSSNSTDSFSFSSSSSNPVIVPSSDASKNDSLSTVATFTTSEPRPHTFLQNNHIDAVTKETIAYSDDHAALKNDNTTIKPRKGVDSVTENSFESVSRSGVKPRKGVSFDGVTSLNNSKSKVKPRKGVGPFQSQSVSPPANTAESSVHETSSMMSVVPNATSSANIYKDTLADDIVSALEKVFEDDSKTNNVKSSIISPASSSTIKKGSQTSAIASSSAIEKVSQTSATVVNSFTPTFSVPLYTSISTDKPTSILQSSLTTNYITSSSVRTPDLVTPTVQTTENFGQYIQPSSSRPSIFEHSKLLFHESNAATDVKSDEEADSEESESQRKYKSSMHLVLSLVFGLLVLFSVLGVIAKRIYDGWLRRHYRRMDFLIDGMYNGYG